MNPSQICKGSAPLASWRVADDDSRRASVRAEALNEHPVSHTIILSFSYWYFHGQDNVLFDVPNPGSLDETDVPKFNEFCRFFTWSLMFDELNVLNSQYFVLPPHVYELNIFADRLA